jgi:protein-L-isoaspartate(D-aspartate) O-methyltransferase
MGVPLVRGRMSGIIMAQERGMQSPGPPRGSRAGGHALRLALVAGLGWLWTMSPGCRSTDPGQEGTNLTPTTISYADSARFAEERQRMVAEQIAARGVRDMTVLQALRTVPRHEFVPEELRGAAYRDSPLPIGHDQTISQPYIVALMTEALALEGGEKVLEVGTGSGYQAAVLDEIAGTVFSIEIVPELAERARATLARLGYTDVRVRVGDGYRGWPEEAPFDAIMVTAAPDHVPQPLLEQLKVGGRLVLPVGRNRQQLQVWTRTADGFDPHFSIPVQFVPMTGEAETAKAAQREKNARRP